MTKHIVFRMILIVSVSLTSTILLEGQSGGSRVYGGKGRSSSSGASSSFLDEIKTKSKSVKNNIEVLLINDYAQYQPHHGYAYNNKLKLEKLSKKMDKVIEIAGEEWLHSREMSEYRQNAKATASREDSSIIGSSKRKEYLEESEKAAYKKFMSRVKSSLKNAYNSLDYSSIGHLLGSIDVDIKSLERLINN